MKKLLKFLEGMKDFLSDFDEDNQYSQVTKDFIKGRLHHNNIIIQYVYRRIESEENKPLKKEE